MQPKLRSNAIESEINFFKRNHFEMEEADEITFDLLECEKNPDDKASKEIKCTENISSFRRLAPQVGRFMFNNSVNSMIKKRFLFSSDFSDSHQKFNYCE